MPRSTTLATVAGGELLLAAFDCPPDDPAWRSQNAIAGMHVVAFPHRAVGIRMHGRNGVVADPNRVMLYDPGRRYERRLIDPAGDHSTYLAVSPGLLAALEVPVVDRGGRVGFVTDHLGLAPDAVLRLRVIVEDVRRGDTDALTVAGELYELTREVLRGDPPRSSGATPGTRRTRRRLVEDARAWVAERVTEQWRLDDLADALHTAPAHLHRVFRSHTGTSVHEHRDRLRLALALDMVLDGADDLSQVAMAVGYSSHSHFTRRFHRTYGTTPSAIRDGLGRSGS